MLLEAFQHHTVVKVLTWSSATINFTRALCSIEMENTGMVIPFFLGSWVSLHGQSCGWASPTLGEGGGGSEESLCPSLIASQRVLNMYPTLKALQTASICTDQLCFLTSSRYLSKWPATIWLWSEELDVCQLNSFLLQRSVLMDTRS